MKAMRALIERYNKWLMIGLVVFLMVIFTATGDFESAFSDDDDADRRPGAGDIAGSFYVVPGVKVDVTNARFTQGTRALQAFSVVTSGRSPDPTVLQTWSHIILAEAASHTGVHVSNRELVNTMRTWNRRLGDLMKDKASYKKWCEDNFRTNRLGFEEAFREALEAYRVRELYNDTYLVAPPATRVKLVDRFAPGSFEYVDVSWAALDAAKYLPEVTKELDDAEDPEKLLKEFFETDPTAKADSESFRHPRRFDFELLYAMHDRLTEENLKQAEKMFFQLWPQHSPEKNDDKDALVWAAGDDKVFYDLYKERLLKSEGKTLEALKLQATARIEKEDKKAEEKPDEPEEKPDEPEEKPDEPEEKPDEPEEKPDEPEEKPDEVNVAREIEKQQRIEKALSEMGLQICAERINRELRLRRMMRLMHNDAYKAPEKSLSKLYEKLQSADDKDNPLCTTEPGKGLFVYRAPEKPLSINEIRELKDGDVTFGPNVAIRVSRVGRKKLPAVGETADVLGDQAQGRMNVRVKSIERARRKTYVELDEDDKATLRDDFYLPQKARDRAQKKLEDLKKNCDEGKVKPDGFGDASRELGARFYDNEKITASSRNLPPEPSDRMFYGSELSRMQDRQFLRRRLAGVLATDRSKPEEERIKPGSWLDVEVQSDTEDPAQDPGTVYLIQLISRAKPTASTMPEESMATAEEIAQQQGISRSRNRWDLNYTQLFRDFELNFAGPMKQRVDSAFDRIAERAADRVSSR